MNRHNKKTIAKQQFVLLLNKSLKFMV